MTDADIIKVLEICLNKSGGCISAKCPLVNDLHCKELLISRCFEIINRQQAEIERLKNDLRACIKEVSRSHEIDRNKAIREFAERLNAEFENFAKTVYYGTTYTLIGKGVVNKVLNEIIGNHEEVKCKDCKHLMYSDCYGECSQGYKGIVQPDDSCKYGERKLK